MTTVHSVHGAFNFRGGGVISTDLFRPYFEDAGFIFKERDYGFRGVIMAQLFNERTAKKLASVVEDGDIGIGHSNGCDILVRAARNGAKFSQLILINPALDADTDFPSHIKRIHVWHSPSDKPVQVARWLPFNHWGEMGSTGFTGYNMRVINYNKEEDFEISSNEHSDIFEPEKLAYFGPIVVERVVALQGI
jgi:hypothetical protein